MKPVMNSLILPYKELETKDKQIFLNALTQITAHNKFAINNALTLLNQTSKNTYQWHDLMMSLKLDQEFAQLVKEIHTFNKQLLIDILTQKTIDKAMEYTEYRNHDRERILETLGKPYGTSTKSEEEMIDKATLDHDQSILDEMRPNQNDLETDF